MTIVTIWASLQKNGFFLISVPVFAKETIPSTYKLSQCGCTYSRYPPMRDALNTTGRKIFYSICEW